MSADMAGPGYRGALEGTAVAARPDRARVRVVGRDPFTMLQGILTNRVPAPPATEPSGVTRGRALYSAVLTPKGRLITDARVLRGGGADDGLLLDLPAAAVDGLLAHLKQYVPPRFAAARNESEATATLTVCGPAAAGLLTREALGLRVEEHDLAALVEDEWVQVEGSGAGMLVLRSAELSAPTFDVIAPRATVEALRTRLIESGAAPLDDRSRAALRVEAGRPSWGTELDQDTLPPEAGIDARAIDHGKGCYTGQEVIVRIRDRGHVNRHLRGFVLGDAALPERGTQLWTTGRDQAVGSITSAAHSPRAGGGLALGYLRREVEVPGEVRLGGPDGARVAVAPLRPEWWRG